MDVQTQNVSYLFGLRLIDKSNYYKTIKNRVRSKKYGHDTFYNVTIIFVF